MDKMSKTRKILAIVTLWFTSFSVMYAMLTYVILNDLYIAFPEGEFFITASLSWPFLLVAISGFVSGWLLKYLTTKQELIIASALIFAGLAPRFIHSPEAILFFVLLQGIGAGFANTAGMAMISQMFADEAKRSKQMGYYNFVMAIMGVIISFLGGIFAVQGWEFGYDVYWIALPMLIMSIFFLPSIKQQADEGENPAEGASTEKGGFGIRFVTFFVSGFAWFLVWILLQGFTSVYVAENALGDVSFAGTCTSLTTVGSAVCCILFGFFFQKLRRKVMVVMFAITVAVYVMLWLAPSAPTAIIGSLLGGACYGIIFTVIYAYSAACVSPEQNGMAMGLMTFDYAFANAVGVYLWDFVMGSTGSVTATLPIGAVIVAIMLVVEIVFCIKDDREGFLIEE